MVKNCAACHSCSIEEVQALGKAFGWQVTKLTQWYFLFAIDSILSFDPITQQFLGIMIFPSRTPIIVYSLPEKNSLNTL